MTKIYFAYYDSRNFCFEAFGKSAAEAKKVLLEGLEEHAKQYAERLEDAHWWYDDDVCVEERTIGVCYRDKSEVRK